MESLKAILKRYGIIPKKGLGQSFLHDERVAYKIVDLADIKEDETVVEIGAGVGLMTRLLAARARKVIALEMDPALVSVLREELKKEHNIEVIETDVLKYDFKKALAGQRGEKIKVVGNIPYYISSPLLFYLLDFREIISSAVLMLQSEVADRLAALPGTKAYGIPTVIVSLYADLSRDLTVESGLFFPRPKVTSAVLTIRFRGSPRIELRNHDFFCRVVKAAFAARRKTLFNNLRGASWMGLADSDLSHILAVLGIDGQRRAEALAPVDLGRLSNALFEELGKKAGVR